LARALVVDPGLLLMDEPLAALDETTRFYLAEELRRLWLARKMTTILVTHSVSEAVFVADRAVVLTQKPARIADDVAIELPRERGPELRTDPRYISVLQKLSASFRKANPRSEA
jgi:NitT/TauT family transport system ATP-binding protein